MTRHKLDKDDNGVRYNGYNGYKRYQVVERITLCNVTQGTRAGISVKRARGKRGKKNSGMGKEIGNLIISQGSNVLKRATFLKISAAKLQFIKRRQ